MISVRFRGMNRVVRNLENQLSQMEQATPQGLLKAALYIHWVTENVTPFVPVKTTNLRRNYYTHAFRPGVGQIGIEFGYRKVVEYAPDVHQMTGAGVRWTRQGSGALWFLKAILQNTDMILRIIRNEARIRR